MVPPNFICYETDLDVLTTIAVSAYFEAVLRNTHFSQISLEGEFERSSVHFHQPCTLLIPTRFYYSFSNVKDSLHLSYQKQRNSNLFYANALARINKVVFNVIPLNKLISGNTKFIRNSPDRIARYYGIVARTCRLIRSRCRTADPYALTRIDVIIFDIVPTAELVHRDTKFISNRPNRVP